MYIKYSFLFSIKFASQFFLTLPLSLSLSLTFPRQTDNVIRINISNQTSFASL